MFTAPKAHGDSDWRHTDTGAGTGHAPRTGSLDDTPLSDPADSAYVVPEKPDLRPSVPQPPAQDDAQNITIVVVPTPPPEAGSDVASTHSDEAESTEPESEYDLNANEPEPCCVAEEDTTKWKVHRSIFKTILYTLLGAFCVWAVNILCYEAFTYTTCNIDTLKSHTEYKAYADEHGNIVHIFCYYMDYWLFLDKTRIVRTQFVLMELFSCSVFLPFSIIFPLAIFNLTPRDARVACVFRVAYTTFQIVTSILSLLFQTNACVTILFFKFVQRYFVRPFFRALADRRSRSAQWLLAVYHVKCDPQ